jgi:hypothetical protein
MAYIKGRKLIIYIFYVLFVIALIELLSYVIYFKVLNGDSYYKKPSVAAILEPTDGYVLHPYFGFSNNPASCYPEGCNSFGFIGAELPTYKKEDTIVIGIFGGSLADKLCAYDMQAFSKKLQQYPFFKNKRIQFTCISLGGFKQPQQLLALNYFLALGVKFDIVINLDGFNDVCLPIAENMPSHIEYSYPRMWDIYARQNFDTLALRQVEKMERIRTSRNNLQASSSRSIFSRSYFFKMIRLVFDRIEIQKYYRIYQYLLKKGNEKSRLYGPKQEYKDTNEILRKSVALWKESSRQMAYLCIENNISYFHFLQPNQYYSAGRRLSPGEFKIAYSASCPYKKAVELGYPLLVREGKNLQKEGIRFFDLTTIFINEVKDIYADDCCHVNALGNQILMDAVVKRIAQYFHLNSKK